MNKKTEHKYKLPEQAKGQPFSVPDGYFESFSDRLKERIKGHVDPGTGEPGDRETFAEKDERSVWMRIRPHFSLAAAIAGFALISFTVIRLLLGTGNLEETYDLAFLEETGILNEAVFQETIYESEEYGETEYTDWEIDAMNYLASNGVNFDALLSEN